MDRRWINDTYKEIAEELIENEPELEYIKESDARIIYLSSEDEKKAKGAVVYGTCEKVPERFKEWAIEGDYIITIYEPNTEGFTNEQIRILLFHELLHIKIDCGVNSIQNHDLNDFKIIVDRFGVDWAEVEDGLDI